MASVLVLGGGPAGNTCASVAATLGAHVTLIERDIVGGAAHLWDCIPSKAMIATGGGMSFAPRLEGMGPGEMTPQNGPGAPAGRVEGREGKVKAHNRDGLGRPAGG